MKIPWKFVGYVVLCLIVMFVLANLIAGLAGVV